ncbi:MAG: flagellar biosynthesis protein FlhF [Rhodanobacter sp.]
MKIKRFTATDMRQAMCLVRDEQGPDAVILSTRRIAIGIEVIAAIDYDESLVSDAVRHHAEPASSPQRRIAPEVTSVAALVGSRPVPRAPLPTHSPARGVEPRTAVAQTRRQHAVVRPVKEPSIEPAALGTAQVREELSSLRAMLETQLSSLAWNDMERRRPLQACVLREMTKIGIDADVARGLVAELPSKISAAQARYLPLGLLTRDLAISGRALEDGPTVTALVGPTGVGKTTTVAKLAARAILRVGAERVALVSTDHYRIGAAAQLEHYGRLLGVRVYPAYDAQSLRKVLELLRDCHTVLVDTAGIAVSDPRLVQQMEIFADAGGLRACLVLAANAQSESLDAAERAYRPLKPGGCILTKLDEAPSLGGALSLLIRHRLPLDYTTDGQRVPEDIAPADARKLVCRAVQPSPGVAPDNSLLAERFGLELANA